jgi:RHS repeat-associated protein
MTNLYISFNSERQPYKFGGKELDEMHGLNWYDQGARPFDAIIPRTPTMDPLAEKYYNTSPYVQWGNNPVRFIDPDGREVVISGVQSDEAVRQLQEKMNGRITLTRNEETGRLSYTVNEGQKLKGDAKRMAGMIDNQSITVNLITTDQNVTSTGNLMVGGAFMGNTVTTDANGNRTVVANQEVNPNVLGSADAHTNTAGKMMMHEATEAYAGAQISQKSGVSSPMAGQEGSVYQQAHKKATPQTPVHENIYDSSGNKLQMLPGGVYPSNVSRVEWYVTKSGRLRVIQTLP